MRSFATCLLVLPGILGAVPCRAGDDVPDAAQAVQEARWAGGIEAARLTRSDTQSEPLRRLPGYRSELNELSYRWWLSTERADVGLGLGTVSYGLRPMGGLRALPGEAIDDASKLIATGTVLTLGMRYRTSTHSAIFADAAGVRGLGLGNGDVLVGKVGVDFKLAQARWNIAYGGLAFRLDGDTRMTLRVRKGGLGLYMRHSF
jgi:hypothetical protein